MEHKKEEFRKYLDNAGVMDALTKVLVGLYEETDKPRNAIDYLKNKMGGTVEESQQVESLQASLQEAQQEIARLKEENARLQSRIVELQGSSILEPVVEVVQVKSEPVDVVEDPDVAQQ